jgi:2-hydroxychromene-2-carboxylate isomerase
MLGTENMQAPKSVSFFFDFSSPFAYLAATQIETLAERHGATVLYKPFLLGALFKSIGTPNVPLHAMPESKARLYRADLFRWADHWNVPFHFASRFPMNTVKPLRLALAAPENKKASLIRAIYRAYWVDDRDISNDEVLLDIIEREGFEPAFFQTTAADQYRKALREATEEAESLGLCGVPSFLVGDQLFWGQDRLIFVEKALDGWRPRSAS